MRNWNSTVVPMTMFPEPASRLPMRNWNLRDMWERMRKKKASRLPMRNWNHPFLPISDIGHRGFQTTYEELKRSSTSTVGLLCFASRLPMRNWNLRCPARSRLRDRASRLPMRNWNVGRLNGFGLYIMLPDYLWGIETQYHFSQSIDWICFQTTYEELKLRPFGFLTVRAVSFQTTYEELKPVENIVISGRFTLPDYLWGIETFPRFLSGLSRIITLPDYLWGTETLALESSTYNCHFRFQTTYEELKHMNFADKNQPVHASRLPMRNWNYFDRERKCGRVLASRLPMRNWNFHFSSQILNLPVLRFQTTYEELKRSIDLFCDLSYRASRLPMRNWNSNSFAIFSKICLLPDYLWGIETSIQRH